MKAISILLLSCLLSELCLAQEVTSPSIDLGGFELESDTFKADDAGWWAGFDELSRITLKHEVSLQLEGEQEIVNNRSSFQFEYEQFFLNNYFVKLDNKVNFYWDNDHVNESKVDLPGPAPNLLRTDNLIREAFIQGSFGNTSVKIGIQNLIWGESDGGAITDVVSPRNFSELFLISLEESRIGQFMLNIDQFSSVGDWSLFFIPEPEFNQYPLEGTQYYIDAFGDDAEIAVDNSDEDTDEYGFRWRKTFEETDLSLMIASLIDNNYFYTFDELGSDGANKISQMRQGFNLYGIAINHARDKSLYSVEFAYKSDLAFSTTDFKMVTHGVIDASIKFEYSVKGSNTIAAELVNRRINDWSENLGEATPKDTTSLTLSSNYTFFNEDLSVSGLATITEPTNSHLLSVFSSYKFTDELSLGVDIHLIGVSDSNDALYSNRKQDQIVVRIQSQF